MALCLGYGSGAGDSGWKVFVHNGNFHQKVAKVENMVALTYSNNHPYNGSVVQELLR